MSLPPTRPIPSLPDARTLTSPLAQAESADDTVLAATLLWHPESDRAGERAVFAAAEDSHLLGRYLPMFFAPGHVDGRPIGHGGVSRSPLEIRVLADSTLRVSLGEGRMRCEIDGELLDRAGIVLDAARLERGAVLQLGGEVFVCLHRHSTLPEAGNPGRLIGASSAMVRVRRQIARAASTTLPVLLLGESGTGKELAAQAIHARSARAGKPFVAVNMAALGENLAAAELFGAARGAYTGATQARTGLFEEAGGGTLFLDEIGDTPAAIQPMLLRVIETGEFRALGGQRNQLADVRLIAATDRALDADRFNQPLLRRIEAITVRLPPLRKRREDLGLLVQHFLREALDGAPAPTPLRLELLSAIFAHDWPGNVRQLGHAVRRLAMLWQVGDWPTRSELLGLDECRATVTQARGAAFVPATVSALSAPLELEPPPISDGPRTRAYRSPSEIDNDALLSSLEHSGWQLSEAALLLGISRPSLYNLLERHPDIRHAEAIDEFEILLALNSGAPETLATLASKLRTPREALRRRLKRMRLAQDLPQA